VKTKIQEAVQQVTATKITAVLSWQIARILKLFC